MRLLEKLKTNASSNEIESFKRPSLYSIDINGLEGRSMRLSEFKGKHILFVNVASKCGFTPQYKELQKLQDAYQEELVIIGCPCNQFAGQEPLHGSELQSFCERNFGVTFPLTEKLAVKGSKQHPLYQWLTKKELNGKRSSSVKWNFQKYLVNEKGELIDHFFSITKPTSSKIIRHLKSN